eukprot:scaffold1132_cov42-Phaeocystis_antarctica.AAC.1
MHKVLAIGVAVATSAGCAALLGACIVLGVPLIAWVKPGALVGAVATMRSRSHPIKTRAPLGACHNCAGGKPCSKALYCHHNSALLDAATMRRQQRLQRTHLAMGKATTVAWMSLWTWIIINACIGTGSSESMLSVQAPGQPLLSLPAPIPPLLSVHAPGPPMLGLPGPGPPIVPARQRAPSSEAPSAGKSAPETRLKTARRTVAVPVKHSTAEHGGESATTRVRVEPSLPLTFGAPSVSNPPWPSEFEGVTDVVPPSPLLPMLPQPLLLPMPPSPPMPPLLENATTSVPSMPPFPLTLRPLTLDAPS